MTQTDAVLQLLRERGDRGLTAMDALREVGSFRLAARIADLHRAGYDIDSRIETLPNGKRIARYRLVAAPVQLSWSWVCSRCSRLNPSNRASCLDCGTAVN